MICGVVFCLCPRKLYRAQMGNQNTMVSDSCQDNNQLHNFILGFSRSEMGEVAKSVVNKIYSYITHSPVGGI